MAFSGKDNSSLDFHKINKNTWQIDHKRNEEIVIKYKVYAFEGSVRMSYLDDGHAFIMPNTSLMFVEDLRNTSSILKLEVPDQWKKVSTCT